MKNIHKYNVMFQNWRNTKGLNTIKTFMSDMVFFWNRLIGLVVRAERREEEEEVSVRGNGG